MKLIGAGSVGILLVVAFITGTRGAETGVPLTADQIVEKAVQRAQRAETGQVAYAYTKVSITEEFDSKGNVRERKERAYDVSFQGGLTRLKLVRINGKKPSDAELQQQAENEATLRRILGQSKNSKGDNRETFLTSELVARYNFKLISCASLDGRPTHRLAFEPNPSAPERRLADRLMNRMYGTVWIDAEDFEVARAEIHLGSEVDLLGGLLGCLKRVAFTISRTRMDDGAWFNTSWIGDFEGRKLLDAKHFKTRAQFSNFRPLGVSYSPASNAF